MTAAKETETKQSGFLGQMDGYCRWGRLRGLISRQLTPKGGDFVVIHGELLLFFFAILPILPIPREARNRQSRAEKSDHRMTMFSVFVCEVDSDPDSRRFFNRLIGVLAQFLDHR
ncbi:MAG: hypothetical protein AAF998_07820 [Bacteroidota bacterium]